MLALPANVLCISLRFILSASCRNAYVVVSRQFQQLTGWALFDDVYELMRTLHFNPVHVSLVDRLSSSWMMRTQRLLRARSVSPDPLPLHWYELQVRILAAFPSGVAASTLAQLYFQNLGRIDLIMADSRVAHVVASVVGEGVEILELRRHTPRDELLDFVESRDLENEDLAYSFVEVLRTVMGHYRDGQ